jgi:hypothetical protein
MASSSEKFLTEKSWSAVILSLKKDKRAFSPDSFGIGCSRPKHVMGSKMNSEEKFSRMFKSS